MMSSAGFPRAPRAERCWGLRWAVRSRLVISGMPRPRIETSEKRRRSPSTGTAASASTSTARTPPNAAPVSAKGRRGRSAAKRTTPVAARPGRRCLVAVEWKVSRARRALDSRVGVMGPRVAPRIAGGPALRPNARRTPIAFPSSGRPQPASLTVRRLASPSRFALDPGSRRVLDMRSWCCISAPNLARSGRARA